MCHIDTGASFPRIAHSIQKWPPQAVNANGDPYVQVQRTSNHTHLPHVTLQHQTTQELLSHML